jgi:hypothetical protein
MDRMNKFMGFYELKGINLPTVPWRLFTRDSVLDPDLLWTVRVAVENSGDLNLPRAVGVRADEALQRGRELLDLYEGRGIVIYYPYFIAQKSGVLQVDCRKTVIEAVDRDLWNLVTYGQKNMTAIFPCRASEEEGVQFFGEENFLQKEEIDQLLGCGAILRGRFRGEISEGKAILAEWSYAYSTDINREVIGERYLVFYELRGV